LSKSFKSPQSIETTTIHSQTIYEAPGIEESKHYFVGEKEGKVF